MFSINCIGYRIDLSNTKNIVQNFTPNIVQITISLSVNFHIIWHIIFHVIWHIPLGKKHADKREQIGVDPRTRPKARPRSFSNFAALSRRGKAIERARREHSVLYRASMGNSLPKIRLERPWTQSTKRSWWPSSGIGAVVEAARENLVIGQA